MIPDDRDLIPRLITDNPDRPGPAGARIVTGGVPVWALTGYPRAVDGDMRRVAKDHDVPEESVRAAIASYERHKAAIDERIRENAATVV